MTRLKRGALALVPLLLGCSGPVVNVAPIPPAAYEELGPTEGSACGMFLLSFLPVLPIGVNDRVERAYAEALLHGRHGATAVIDTSITETWYFALIGTVVCTEVEGLAIRRIESNTPHLR